MTGRLIHLDGAPGVGKSALARAWAAARPGWLNLDIDLLRQLIGGWDDDHDHVATGVEMDGLDVAGSLVELEDLLSRGPDGSA